MGEIAALLTAACWAVSSIFFTTTSREVGAVTVNRVRLIFTVILVLIAHTLLTGHPLPLDAEPFRWLWLGLSGVVGLVLGDSFLFESYRLIGNRLGTLLMASVPVVSSLEAWIFLKEDLRFTTILGILVCVGGISLVVLERKTGNGAPEKGQYLRGVLFGLGGVVGQASGLVVAKLGLVNDFPSISGVAIRMVTAMVVLWAAALLLGQAKPTLQKVLSRPWTVRYILGGSLIGPFIGVWLSQIAIQRTYVGIASTLMALTPILMLPIAHWYYKERVSPRAFLGTVVALAGAAVIFL
jgi:drug/metabolite transporter (DMT)-like permease